MTNEEHAALKANLKRWSVEDLHALKTMVEAELLGRDPELQEWMSRLAEDVKNYRPTHLRLVK